MITIGYIIRPFGVHGEVCVQHLLDSPNEFKKFNKVSVILESEKKTLTIEKIKYHKGYLIVKFSEINDRTSAELLRKFGIFVEKSELLPLPEGRYYVSDIIGLNVMTTNGEKLGTITDVIHLFSNDVYQINGDNGEILIPAIEDVVKSIDIEKKIMVVELMEEIV